MGWTGWSVRLSVGVIFVNHELEAAGYRGVSQEVDEPLQLIVLQHLLVDLVALAPYQAVWIPPDQIASTENGGLGKAHLAGWWSLALLKAPDAEPAALGFDPDALFVPHPIQDRTDDEMAALADSVLESILQKLTA